MKRKLLLISVVVVLVCTAAAFFATRLGIYPLMGSDDATVPPEHSGMGKSSGREVPQGQLEYYNPHYRFSFFYPDVYTVDEYQEAGDSVTVTFEYVDKEVVSGFQLYITPYQEEQITDERFRQDVPSGVRQGLKDVQIDGATGASFYSTDEHLGETAEIWFIRNGYLYEATTFRELAPTLDEVMQTWRFVD